MTQRGSKVNRLIVNMDQSTRNKLNQFTVFPLILVPLWSVRTVQRKTEFKYLKTDNDLHTLIVLASHHQTVPPAANLSIFKRLCRLQVQDTHCRSSILPQGCQPTELFTILFYIFLTRHITFPESLNVSQWWVCCHNHSTTSVTAQGWLRRCWKFDWQDFHRWDLPPNSKSYQSLVIFHTFH